MTEAQPYNMVSFT